MISMDKKYRTRDGRDVRIYATDGAPIRPIHGAYATSQGDWIAEQWRVDGLFSNTNHRMDLIEVRTAEDVVASAIAQHEFDIRTCETGQPIEFDIVQALRDAGKMKDGE